MRLAWTILKKDIRRLWWEVAVTNAALAILARLDSQRGDHIAGPLDSLLNLLVPAAWAYVIALLVHEEPLVGDDQFWITRPYPRLALLGAKALFALAFIHLPSLLAGVMILSARGFQPLQYVPQLLWKQLVAGVVVVLPALALASVTRNLAQFASACAAIVLGGGLLANSIEPLSVPWIEPDKARRSMALAPLVVAGALIIALQYRRRRTALARTAGIAAIFAAGALFAYLPRETVFATQCAAQRAPTDLRAISIAVNYGAALPPSAHLPRPRGSGVPIAIPIAISGVPPQTRLRVEQLELAIASPGGVLWRTAAAPGRRTLPKAYLSLKDQQTGWQVIYLEPSLVSAGKVGLSGKAAVRLYGESSPQLLPVGAASREVPGLGRCSNGLVSDLAGPDLLKVVCESPSEAPMAGVGLVRRDQAREWKQRLGDSAPSLAYIATTWLSPVQRRQTFFHIVDEHPTQEGSRWLVPREDLASASIVLTPEYPAGCGVVRYEWRDLDLRDFVVKRSE